MITGRALCVDGVIEQEHDDDDDDDDMKEVIV